MSFRFVHLPKGDVATCFLATPSRRMQIHFGLLNLERTPKHRQNDSSYCLEKKDGSSAIQSLPKLEKRSSRDESQCSWVLESFTCSCLYFVSPIAGQECVRSNSPLVDLWNFTLASSLLSNVPRFGNSSSLNSSITAEVPSTIPPIPAVQSNTSSAEVPTQPDPLYREAIACQEAWASWFHPPQLPVRSLLTSTTYLAAPTITGAASSTSLEYDSLITRIKFLSAYTSWSTCSSRYTPRWVSGMSLPTPECKIQSSYCDKQWSSLSIADEKYFSSFFGYTVTGYTSYGWVFEAARYAMTKQDDFLGGCTMPLKLEFCNNSPMKTISSSMPCSIVASNFALFRWPAAETRQSGDFPVTSKSQVSSARVVEVDALTMTLQKVPYSYDDVLVVPSNAK
jgi:hypothetical protein